MIDDTDAPCDPAADYTTENTVSIETEIEEMRRLAVEIALAWSAPESGVELIERATTRILLSAPGLWGTESRSAGGI